MLYLSFYCSKLNSYVQTMRGIGKIVFAALLGTIVEILGLLWSSSYDVFILYVHLLEMPLMMLFVLGKEKRKILSVILSGYFYIILLNGVLEALWNLFGKCGNFLFYLLLSCGAVIIGVRLWKNHAKMEKGIFQVYLRLDENQVQTYALYDTGNRLKDPYTQSGVHIVSEHLLEKLGVVKIVESGLLEEKNIKHSQVQVPVYIPYQALGNESGLLEVYYVEELIVEGEKQRIRIPNCPLGVTKDDLFEEKKYEMILNEEVF